MPTSDCPICKKSTTKEFSPFCSERCQMVDLNKWLTESYTVPAEEGAELSQDESE